MILIKNFKSSLLMAERAGFEPAKELTLYTLSKRAPSTTQPSLQYLIVKLIINNRTILNKNIGTKIYYIIKIYMMQLKMIIPVN